MSRRLTDAADGVRSLNPAFPAEMAMASGGGDPLVAEDAVGLLMAWWACSTMSRKCLHWF